MDEPAARLRLRLPNGAELEASGESSFVVSERAVFLALNASPETPALAPGGSRDSQAGAAWETLIESHGGHLQLRAKLKGGKDDKDACLLLLAAAEKLLHLNKPTAAQLACWLRASGYPIQRVDRSLQKSLDAGEILASGSRRARRYELSGPGRVKAALLARQLNRDISGS